MIQKFEIISSMSPFGICVHEHSSYGFLLIQAYVGDNRCEINANWHWNKIEITKKSTKFVHSVYFRSNCLFLFNNNSHEHAFRRCWYVIDKACSICHTWRHCFHLEKMAPSESKRWHSIRMSKNKKWKCFCLNDLMRRTFFIKPEPLDVSISTSNIV